MAASPPLAATPASIAAWAPRTPLPRWPRIAGAVAAFLTAQSLITGSTNVHRRRPFGCTITRWNSSERRVPMPSSRLPRLGRRRVWAGRLRSRVVRRTGGRSRRCSSRRLAPAPWAGDRIGPRGHGEPGRPARARARCRGALHRQAAYEVGPEFEQEFLRRTAFNNRFFTRNSPNHGRIST